MFYIGPVALTGGDDRLAGGAGNDSLTGDGSATSASGYAAVLTGGDDTLDGGGGRDSLVGDGSVTSSGAATVAGGDDRLVGGAGNDSLTGDGSAATTGGGAVTLDGGADTFVFGSRDGRDTVTDFRSADGDRLDLRPAGIGWAALDSDGSGTLDDADACVAVAAGDLRLDLGLAGGAAAGLHVVTLAGVTGLAADDLLLLA